MNLRPSFLPLFAVTTLCILLSGCALEDSVAPVAQQGVAITGRVHGGQSPVSGARIYLIGYGYGDIVTSSGPAGPNGVDGIGNYVVSDSNGNFSLTSNYTCVSGTLVYLLARFGNPGLGSGKSNPALGEMAILGACPAAGFFPSSMFVDVSEVSTVAAVYSLAGYLTGPSSYYFSNSDRSKQAVSFAFAIANSIVPTSTGTAVPTTSAGGVVPFAKMNLLANILAACINSDGSTSTTIGTVTTPTACGNLFANATSDGTSTGTQPFDTVTALLNIVHHPGANAAALFAIASPLGPYQPALVSPPNDLALAITFSLKASGLAETPNQIAVDANNNVYIPGTLSNGVSALLRKDPLGNDGPSKIDLSGSVNSVNYPVTSVNAVAVAPLGDLWYGTNSQPGGYLGHLTPSGSTYLQTGYTGGGFNGQTTGVFYTNNMDDDGVAILVPDYTTKDLALFQSNGNAFLSGLESGSAWNGVVENKFSLIYLVTSASNTGATYTVNPIGQETHNTFSNGGLNQPNSLAVDSTNSVWVTNGNNSLSKFASSDGNGGSAAISPTSGYTGGGLNFNVSAYSTVPIVVDGANSVWVPNYAGQSISTFTSAGVPVSPSTGYSTGCPSKGLAVDQIGNVWVSCQNGTLLQFLGLATPVFTPITSSFFGTRP